MRKIPILLLFLSLTVFLVSLTVFPLEDADIWYHLALGRYISENHFQPPDVDPFSWPIPNLKAVADTTSQMWEWGSELLTYLLYEKSGFTGIIIAKSLLIVAVFLLLYLYSRKKDTSFILSMLLLILGIFASAERFIERIEHIGYLLLVILVISLYYLQNVSLENKSTIKRYLIFLSFFLFFLTFANLHGSFVLGLVIVWLVAIYQLLQKNSAQFFLALAISATLGSLVNPYGSGLITYWIKWFDWNRANLYLREIYEWQSPFYGFHSIQLYSHIFRILLGLYWGLFFLAVYRKKATFLSFVLLSLSTYLAVNHARQINVFVIFGFFAACEGLQGFRLSWEKQKVTGVLLNLGLSVVLTALAFYFMNSGYQLGTTVRRFGSGVKQIVPERAVKFLDENGIWERVLNQYELGGYLMWSSEGKRKVFIDGRSHFPEDFFREYLQMSKSAKQMRQVLDKYQVEAVISLYPPTESNQNVADYLSVSAQWSLVYWDDYYLIFIKRLTKFQPIIERYGYSYADPLKLQREGYVARLDGSEGSILRRRIIDELERTVKDNPDNSKAHTYLGSMYEGEGYWDQAIKEYEKAISKNSENPTPFLLLAGVYIKKEELGEAKKILEKVLKINPNLPSPYLILGQMEERDKNYREAMKLYNKALVRGSKIGAVYFRMGVIYSSAIYNKSKARQNLTRAIELGLSDSEENLAKQILQSL